MPRTHDVLDALGGIARGIQLAEFGITRRHTSDAVRDNEIDRIRPGVFATLSAPRSVRTAAAHGGSLTCAGALRRHGVWVLHDDDAPHVWMGATGRTHPHSGCHCVAHFHRGKSSLGIAPLEQALVHAYQCHGAEFFFCAFESAWNRRKLGGAARARIRRALPSRARWLVDFARDDAQSGLESLVRIRLHFIGITVQTQVEIPGVGRVDFVIEGRVILEADSEEHHGGARNRRRDLRRDAIAAAVGYETLRFDYTMILHDWQIVVRAVQAALERART